MRFKLTSAIGLLTLMNVNPAWADADAKRGADVFQICVVCHGEQAQGNEGFGSPKLAGQHDWYLATQLENFRAGIRGTHEDDDNGQVMQPMAAALTDQQIEDVIAYIMTLDPNFVEEE